MEKKKEHRFDIIYGGGGFSFWKTKSKYYEINNEEDRIFERLFAKIEEEKNEIIQLSLSKRGIYTLPESIGDLSSLTHLDLSGNHLFSLPESIGDLISLESLILRGNRLSSLPESICNLKSLTTLYLSENQLTSLPESIGNLKSLENLILCGNQFTSLPKSIWNLKSLICLDLTSNQLSSLPKSIGNLTSLQRLYLNYNQLTTLPDNIGDLTSLQELDLKRNLLTYIPESIGSLISLVRLNLEFCVLTSLYDKIEKAMEMLNKNGCTIEHYNYFLKNKNSSEWSYMESIIDDQKKTLEEIILDQKKQFEQQKQYKEQQEDNRLRIIESINYGMDQKSVCFTPIPINAALKAADDWLGKDLPWFPVNDIQKEYMEKYFEKETAENYFVKRIASDKSEEIKQFLSENGFPEINLPEISFPEFGIAGVMDQKVEWKKKMKSTKIFGIDGNIYDAVDFDKHFIVFKSSFHSHPIVKLETKSADSVYLTFLDIVIDDEVKMGINMADIATKIINEKTNKKLHYDNVFIPKIDYSGEIDVDWIVDMKTVDLWFIKWAKMMAKLRLNHIGARAQAAFIGTMTAGLPPPPKILKFDRPFMIWFTHKDQVTFVMFVGFENWKNPGDNIF